MHFKNAIVNRKNSFLSILLLFFILNTHAQSYFPVFNGRNQLVFATENDTIANRIVGLSKTNFICGRALAIYGNSFTYINRLGERVKECTFEEARSFSPDGLAAVSVNNKWGFADTTGAIVIPCKYETVIDFRNKKSLCYLNGYWFVIDKKGNNIFSFMCDQLTAFQGDTVFYQTGIYNYIYLINKGVSKKILGNVPAMFTQQNMPVNNRLKSVAVQTTSCPFNLDMELGDFTNWDAYTGTTSASGVTNIINVSKSAPIPGIHTIYAKSASNPIDKYGLFPINPPDGSTYAAKLGNTNTGAEAERLRYAISVPVNAQNFSITYKYAVVFQDPGHNSYEQPRFSVKVFDSLTNTYYGCSTFEYIATSGLPGFQQSAIASDVFYKPWSSVYVNLKPYAGKTIYLEFTTADCTKGGHWGYAYFDIDNICNYGGLADFYCTTPTKTVLNAPPGYQSYNWWDQSFSTAYGSGAQLTLTPAPAPNSIVNLDIIPFVGFGCRDTVQFQVVPSYPVANAGVDITICSGYHAQLGSSPVSGFDYSWLPATNLNNPLIANPVLSAATSGQYVVTATNVVTSCFGTDTITINVNPTPKANFIINGNSNCVNNNLYNFLNQTVSIDSTIFYWDFGDGHTSSTINPVHNFTTDGVFTIKLVATSANGCSDSIQQTITIAPKPSPGFTTNNAIQCFNGNLFVFTNNSTISSGINSYTWSFGDSTFSNTVNPTHSYASPGLYSVKLGVVSNFGCADSVIYDINVFPNPFASFNILGKGDCLKGNNYQFSNTSLLSNGSITSNWSFGDGTSLSSLNAIHSYGIDGKYDILLTATSDKGCIDTAKQSIIIYPSPISAYSTNNQIQCFAGNNFVFTNSTVINSGVLSYNWIFGDGKISGNTDESHQYLVPGTFPVSLIATSNFGCTDTAISLVTVNPSPVVDFNILSSGNCVSDNNFNFTNNSLIDFGSLTYNWTFGDGNSANTTNTAHIFTSDGVYNIQLIATSDKGCEDTTLKSVTVFPTPLVSFSINADVQCLNGNNFIFTNGSTITQGTNNYQWYFGDGLGSSISNALHSYTVEGNYSVKIIAVSDKGCRDSLIQSVVVHANPIVSIAATGPLIFCAGNSLDLTSNSIAGSGSITSYQWYENGFDIVNAINNKLTVIQTGNYSLMVKNSNGCSTLSQLVPIIVNPIPVGNIQLPFTNDICEGNTVQLLASGASLFQWYLNGNIIPGAVNANYDAPAGGVYSVELTNNYGCKNFAFNSVTMHLIKKPIPDFSYSTFCAGLPSFFKNNSNVSESGPVSWSWDMGNGKKFYNESVSDTFYNGGNYYITLTATPSFCPGIAQSTIKSINIEEPFLGKRYQPVHTSRNVPLQLSARNIGTAYNWIPDRGLSFSQTYSPVFTYDKEQEYNIVITTPSGCTTVDTQLVRVLANCDIFLPKAFTPNGDGANDKLTPINAGIKDFKYFRVYNRWGQLVFETTQFGEGWDGMYKNKKQPIDTYIWMVDGVCADGTPVNKTGNTVLIR